METPMNFDPMTGQPITSNSEEKQKNTGLIIGIVIGVVAVIAAIVAIVVMLIFHNGKSQVDLAIKNTYEEFNDNNQLIKVFDIKDIVKDKVYTIDMDVNTEIPSVGDISVESKVSVDKDIIQASGDLDLSYLPSIEYTLQMDDHMVKGSVPLLDKYLFVYDYTKENNGYLMSEVDSDTINTALAQSYHTLLGNSLSEDADKELVEAYKELFDSLKYNKLKSEEYAIDGKAVKCKGYAVTIPSDDINKLLTATNDILYKDYKPLMDISDIDEYTSLYEGSDINVEFYIYRNTLAAVNIISDGEKLEVRFEGGNYRAQNVKVIENDIEVMSIVGSYSDGIEDISIDTVDGYSLGYAYDTNKDKLDLRFSDGYDVYNVALEVIRSKTKLELNMDFLDLGDTYVGGSLVLSDGATLKELSGTEFNVGTATEDDCMEIVEEIYSIALGLMGW